MTSSGPFEPREGDETTWLIVAITLAHQRPPFTSSDPLAEKGLVIRHRNEVVAIVVSGTLVGLACGSGPIGMGRVLMNISEGDDEVARSRTSCLSPTPLLPLPRPSWPLERWQCRPTSRLQDLCHHGAILAPRREHLPSVHKRRWHPSASAAPPVVVEESGIRPTTARRVETPDPVRRTSEQRDSSLMGHEGWKLQTLVLSCMPPTSMRGGAAESKGPSASDASHLDPTSEIRNSTWALVGVPRNPDETRARCSEGRRAHAAARQARDSMRRSGLVEVPQQDPSSAPFRWLDPGHPGLVAIERQSRIPLDSRGIHQGDGFAPLQVPSDARTLDPAPPTFERGPYNPEVPMSSRRANDTGWLTVDRDGTLPYMPGAHDPNLDGPFCPEGDENRVPARRDRRATEGSVGTREAPWSATSWKPDEDTFAWLFRIRELRCPSN
jgi:hypothetical protein